MKFLSLAGLVLAASLCACGGGERASALPPVHLAATVVSRPLPPAGTGERGACVAAGVVHTVQPDMTVTQIQNLIAAAADGDTILFKPGTYPMLSFEVKRKLQLIGEAPGQTVLVGTTVPSTGWQDPRNGAIAADDPTQLRGAGILFRGIWNGHSADGSCVAGLTLRFYEQAMRVEHGENILFENNRFESAFGDGLVLKDTKDVIVRDNQFLDPYLSGDAPGTLAGGFPDGRRDAQMDYAISVYGSINPRVHHNYFHGFFNQTLSFKHGNVDAYAADNTFEGSRLTALYFGQEPEANPDDPGDAAAYQRFHSFARERGLIRAYNNVFRPVKTLFKDVMAEYPVRTPIRTGWLDAGSTVDVSGNVVEGATEGVRIACVERKVNGVWVGACPDNTIAIHENLFNGRVTDAAGQAVQLGTSCAVNVFREAENTSPPVGAAITVEHLTVANYRHAVCTLDAPLVILNALVYANTPPNGFSIKGGYGALGYVTFFQSGAAQGEASRTDDPGLVGNVPYAVRPVATVPAAANESPLSCGFKPGATSSLQGTGAGGSYRGAFAPDAVNVDGVLVATHGIGPGRGCPLVMPAPPGTY